MILLPCSADALFEYEGRHDAVGPLYDKEYARLKNYFSDTLKMPLALLQKAKPYFLVALLYPRMMNCSSPAGVEEELVKLAKEDKKEIQGFGNNAIPGFCF